MWNQTSQERADGARWRSTVNHLVILVSLATLIVFAAYQVALPMKIVVGDESDRDIKGFYDSDRDAEHTYRWTRGNGVVTFTGVGNVPSIRLTVLAYAWRFQDTIYTSTVTVNSSLVGVIDRAGWRTWRFNVPNPGTISGEDLVVGFDSTPFVTSEVTDSEDDRPLGIRVNSVEIQPQLEKVPPNASWTERLTIPSLPQWLFVVAIVSAAYLYARYLGLDSRRALYLGIAATIAFGIGIAFYRIEVSQRSLTLTLVVGAAAIATATRGHSRSILKVGRGAWRRVGWWALPIGVALVALILRLHASAALPVEGDDGLYMKVAEEYAKAIQARDWNHVIALDGVIEHPRLYVLCLSAALIIRDYFGLAWSNVAAMRMMAVFFGAWQAGLVALLNPIAGWFLAIQTTEIKFTSMAYLEALPALAAAITVLGFERFRRTNQNVWLYVSAVALGAAGASKFIYVTAGFAVAPFLLWEQRHQPRRIIAYGLLALAAFFLLDPYLWHDPVGRLVEMFSFHASFSTREYVKELARPWYYNLVWLSHPAKIYAPDYFFPNIFLIYWDTIIYILSILGLALLFKQSRLYFAWLLAGVIFVSLWEAKWEQYSLLIATPLCISAGLVVSEAAAWVGERLVRSMPNRVGAKIDATD